MLNLCLVNSILKPHIYPHDYSQNVIEKILLREKFHAQFIFFLGILFTFIAHSLPVFPRPCADESFAKKFAICPQFSNRP